ncbi:MAG: SDR family oxidoreductase [Candidatus Heimdallarchaeota archaeon]|nr:SDR family oxidoreductase [Candidatus Heimdallarchaeota archaeon]
MKGKIIFISGSTDGIGKQAALELAKQGAHVIIHGRNEDKIKKTLDFIRSQTENENIDFILADMSSFKQIKAMSDELHKRYDKIDVLVNNAGVQIHGLQFSEDGIELTLAVNHFAYFYTTSLLIDLVAKSDYKRIAIVSSSMHFRMEKFDFDYIQGKPEYSLYMYYAQSKLANVLFGYKLSQVLKDSGIIANILCPGLIDTNLNPQRPQHIVDRALPVEQGIISTMHLVTSPELKGVTGKFYSSDGTETESSPASYNLDDQEKLWTLSEELIGEKFRI